MTINGRTLSPEALKKANHSMVERRRREKINAALDKLRQMVPGLGEAGGKSGEFKLEVSDNMTNKNIADIVSVGLGTDSRPHARPRHTSSGSRI